MSKPNPPEALAEAGQALWREVVEKYDLRADELTVLELAGKTADMVATLDREWANLGKPFLTRGSMGQDVIHPLIGEKRTQQAALAKFLAQLKLPEDATAGGVATNPARAASAARWKHGA